MPDKHYYVSAQRGNDSNDGLSPSTAWKTLTKAANSVSPATDGFTYVHIGPGIYREKFISPSGSSASAKVIWAGDPYCLYLTGDKPGRIRITGCNADEYPTNGKVLDWTGRSNVELWDVEVDGSANDYAVYNVEVCRRVNVTSYLGCYFSVANSAAYDCTAVAHRSAFVADAAISFYRCVGLAAIDYPPFSGINSATNKKAYNCVAIGGSAAYHYINPYNCMAIGSSVLCNLTSTGECIGNIGIIHRGTQSTANSWFRNLFLCSYVQLGNDHLGVYGSSNSAGDVSLNIRAAPHFTLDYQVLRQLCRLLDIPHVAAYYPHNSNKSSSYTMNLSAERIYAFTPPAAGRSYGVSVYPYSLSASGNITAELQKYSGGVWVTQASKTFPVTALAPNTWCEFTWDNITGDVQLTATSDTWRFRFTADGDAATSSLYGSSATTPSVLGWYIPDSVLPHITEDIFNQQRYSVPLVGPAVLPDLSLDYNEYYTNYPSIKIVGAGEKTLELPAKGGEPISVSYYVKHTGAASGKKPQLKVRGPGVTEQAATHTAGINQWQKLEVSVTPPVDAVLSVVLSSQDENATVYFSDPYVS